MQTTVIIYDSNQLFFQKHSNELQARVNIECILL